MRITLSLLTLSFLLLLGGCSSFINNMHRQMDKEYESQRKGSAYSDRRFDQYRKRPQSAQRRYSGPTTNSQQSIQPTVKRYYKTTPQEKKRYRADDLVDNGSDGSLWAGTGNDNYLFSSDKIRKIGDIVLINVQGKLKNEITMELKRMFPPLVPKKKKDGTPAAPAADANAGDNADASNMDEETKDSNRDKVYDRFTSIIMEEINRDHMLIKAQKNVLYKKRKRLIEVQALVAKKDIRPDDTIDSNDFLETTIQVIR